MSSHPRNLGKYRCNISSNPAPDKNDLLQPAADCAGHLGPGLHCDYDAGRHREAQPGSRDHPRLHCHVPRPALPPQQYHYDGLYLHHRWRHTGAILGRGGYFARKKNKF